MAHILPYPLPDRDTCTLDEWKQYKMELIDDKSSELISNQGFLYNGKTFSLRKTSQLNILGVERRKELQGLLPVTFNTIDNMDTEALATPGQVDSFFDAALAAKKSILDSGTALKDQIRAAADKDAVDAIEDNR